MVDIWQFQRRVARRLLLWAGLSMFVGFGMWLDTQRPLRATGMQFFVWGLIDALIALGGQRAAAQRRRSLPDPYAPPVVQQERRNLRRLLWINAGLDVGYITGALWLMRRKDDRDGTWRGHGRGVLVQGAFLWLFDVWHALRLRERGQR